MDKSAELMHRYRPRLAPAVVALVLLAAYLGGCGQRTPVGSVDDLFIANQRYNIDRDRGVVRVFAQVVNEGEGIVRQVKMEAVLYSAEGQKRGTNNVILTDIKPGERRDFAIMVTSHSHSERVEITPKEVE